MRPSDEAYDDYDAEGPEPDYAGEFASMPWHDAQLLEIRLNRRNPGKRDDVEFIVRWLDDTVSRLILCRCRTMKAALNFGIICNEAIDEAYEVLRSPMVEAVVQKWRQMKIELSGLRHFRICTSSTGGTIDVIAERFTFEAIEE